MDAIQITTQPTNQSILPVKKEMISPSPDELVMKPTPIPAEDRMKQVISPQLLKGLLSLVVPGNRSGNAEHSLDITA